MPAISRATKNIIKKPTGRTETVTGIQSVRSEETAVPPPYPDFNLALFLSIGCLLRMVSGSFVPGSASLVAVVIKDYQHNGRLCLRT
ncbi:protein ENHANCED DISEASE RESISTANCE 2 [Gossypium australe]|uniref:Protein ENHANCED DISEASE RESISTANCE 2 n=1 Tax=Gossypium australe TaxID=47621 RepID=A0A5B6UTM4_9ROSI|nr:protein ENHANCED DISEASE RESISTANCE 2 [Gossypium australe]